MGNKCGLTECENTINKGRKYCSVQCSNKSKRVRINRNCLTCQQEFRVDNRKPNQVYCSRGCVKHKRAWPEGLDENILQSVKRYTKRLCAINKLGGRCIICGINRFEVLEIDHVNNDGNIERRTVSYYKMLSNILEGKLNGYQVLCANCHTIKTKRASSDGIKVFLELLENGDLPDYE